MATPNVTTLHTYLKDTWHEDGLLVCPPLLLAGLFFLADFYYNSYPTALGGLYLEFTTQILAHNGLLPSHIPGYTTGGVPYAYPPLAFYLLAGLQLFPGIDGLLAIRILPKLWWIASILIIYRFAAAYFDSKATGSLAAMFVYLVFGTFGVFRHGGGATRAGLLFTTILGSYLTWRVYASPASDQRWVLYAALGFGLSLLIHPLGGVTYGAVVLTAFLVQNRTIPGFLRGITIAGGGLAVSFPWWGSVLLMHGPDILIRTALLFFGMYDGGGAVHRANWLLGSFRMVAKSLAVTTFDTTFSTELVFVWYLGLLGIVDQLRHRKVLFGAWMLVFAGLYPRFSFLFLLFYAAAGFRRLLEWIRHHYRRPRYELPTSLSSVAISYGDVVVAALVCGLLISSGVAATGAVNTSPAFLSESHVEAMEWVAAETSADASFVVTSGPIEWFPYFSNRTILIGFWGVEWKGDEAWRRQLTLTNHIRSCKNPQCVTSQVSKLHAKPDYLYISRRKQPGLARAAVTSPTFELVYKNQDAMIFEYQS
ncbi:ArnT family glycosyltransferase [Halorussus halophilus]|uniref:ArnT family glycosyltransferase n=1 Tax=Halorussus halophilus TaxID=2650975 RepID=UPI001300DDE6|nr:glycosyltransferase family 39 protein [Halorussus halophilus]